MKQFKLLLGADILYRLVRLVFNRNLIIVENILFVKFSCKIYIYKSIRRQTFVGVRVHAKCVLAQVVNIIETYVDIRYMPNLMLGQYTEDPLLHDHLLFTSAVLQCLLIVWKWFWQQEFPGKWNQGFYVAGHHYFTLLFFV